MNKRATFRMDSEPVYRIGMLPSANNRPVFVEPDCEVQEAVSLMIAREGKREDKDEPVVIPGPECDLALPFRERALLGKVRAGFPALKNDGLLASRSDYGVRQDESSPVP